MSKYPKIMGFIISLFIFWITTYVDNNDNVYELILSMLNGIAFAAIVGMIYELYMKPKISYISAYMLVGGLMSSSISYTIVYFYRIYTNVIQFSA